MAIRIVRLGSPRASSEGVRLGTVRRPPRGVRKSDYASRDYYDAWLPELAPSAALLGWFKHVQPIPDNDWAVFTKRYRAEMQAPEAQHLLGALAQLSKRSDFSVGCYCEDFDRCHRSILGELLREHGADIAGS
ncbi:MAG TPA: DUF488 family protein, partial [Usitatibacter sp.]|nr:DUF488 family protein [Usitatibacter sp.]